MDKMDKNLQIIKAINLLREGAAVVGVGIVLGAFGAHGLAKFATTLGVTTFQTGVTYQLYHGFALLILGLLALLQRQSSFTLNLTVVRFFFWAGILLFSGNCYLYAITQEKFFALLVPFGGTSYIIGWLWLFLEIMKAKKLIKAST